MSRAAVLATVLILATAEASPVWTNDRHPGGYRNAHRAAPATSYGPSNSPTESVVLDNACASIRSLALEALATAPDATPTVPAALAYECINSVPFNRSAAVDLLDSIRPYLDWQTTIQWIKDPPLEYAEKVQAPYDVRAEFESIYGKALAGEYASEYEFGFALYLSFQQAHDGHFVIFPDSVVGIFSFARTTPLVSVSIDGTSVPEVFVYSDILDTTVGSASFTPSPLALINGQNSTEYLLNWAQYGSPQDKDALWNNLFYMLAMVSLGQSDSGSGTGTFSGGGYGQWIYPGESTTLTFANGSEVTSENFARVLAPFDYITSGADIYKEFFIPPPGGAVPAEQIAIQTTTSSATPTPTPSATTTIPAPGFPSPFIRQANNTNSGYFLEGEGYDDVAVLSVQSFLDPQYDGLPFQAVNTYLIDQAVARNKTKLIIDVSANDGGSMLQGYDLFKQLFPQLLPYGAHRFRAHEAFVYIGQEVSELAGRVERSFDLDSDTLDLVSSYWNYQTDTTANYTNFESWGEKYGPETFGPGPDSYTTLVRWNMSDVLTPINSGGIYISGYLDRSNITTQPFAAENIVIVTDGYCASTCTIFSELMRQQAGVKTIFLGGRPNSDIAQAIGGVKGTNTLSFETILRLATVPFSHEYVNSREFYKNSTLGAYNDLVLFRTSTAGVNVRDGFRQNDSSSVPLHFQYEPADCRIFYTPLMAVDMTAAWKTVADTAVNGINHCVAGGFPELPAKAKVGEEAAMQRQT